MREQHPPSPYAVSVENAAGYIGIGRSTLYQMIARGELQTFKIGRRTLIRTIDLERLVDGGRAISTSTGSENK